MSKFRIPLVIKANGETELVIFPVELSTGDELLICEERARWQVPKDHTIVIGYSDYGPILSD